MSGNFYRAFEDRYRGARELIKTRLMAYQPFLAPLAALYPDGAALDLGCGRGEWLELLGEQGFDARGVDLDEGMLAACRERGLRAELTDALSALRAQPDASLALVSAFHLVEHIAFEHVQDLIREALRALRPGGLLIMETPNPENLVVGASSFYMDPSHLKPVPAPLLGFVVEYSGFARHALLRLQENAALHQGGPIGLINVLDGVSPDYAIVGQAGAPAAMLEPFGAAFGARYGISLADLAQRYEGQEAARHAEVHRLIERLDVRSGADTQTVLASLDAVHKGVARVADGVENNRGRLDLIEPALREADARLERVQAQAVLTQDALAREAAAALQRGQTALREEFTPRLDLLTQRIDAAEARARQAEDEAAQQRRQVADLLASSSWRVTAPLRAGADLVHASARVGRRLRAAQREGRLGGAVKRRAAGPLVTLMRRLLRYPRVKRGALSLLRHFPGLHARLYRLLRRGAAAAPAPAPQELPGGADGRGALSARTRQAYDELQQAIEARKN